MKIKTLQILLCYPTDKEKCINPLVILGLQIWMRASEASEKFLIFSVLNGHFSILCVGTWISLSAHYTGLAGLCVPTKSHNISKISYITFWYCVIKRVPCEPQHREYKSIIRASGANEKILVLSHAKTAISLTILSVRQTFLSAHHESLVVS